MPAITVLRTGTIKKLVRERGFGFLTPDDDDIDCFFHASGVKNMPYDELTEGLRVEFNTQSDTKGRGIRAINVLVL